MYTLEHRPSFVYITIVLLRCAAQIYGPKVVVDEEKVSKYFKMVSPEGVPLEYKEIAARLNTAYVLSIKNQLSHKHKVEVGVNQQLA